MAVIDDAGVTIHAVDDDPSADVFGTLPLLPLLLLLLLYPWYELIGDPDSGDDTMSFRLFKFCIFWNGRHMRPYPIDGTGPPSAPAESVLADPVVPASCVGRMLPLELSRNGETEP